MNQWKYEIDRMHADKWDSIEWREYLNKIGLQGWQLVQIDQRTGITNFYWKKPLSACDRCQEYRRTPTAPS